MVWCSCVLFSPHHFNASHRYGSSIELVAVPLDISLAQLIRFGPLAVEALYIWPIPSTFHGTVIPTRKHPIPSDLGS